MRRDAKRHSTRKVPNLDALLKYLCVDLGFCNVSASDVDPLPSVEEFVEIVLRKEGFGEGFNQWQKPLGKIVAEAYVDMGVATGQENNFPTT